MIVEKILTDESADKAVIFCKDTKELFYEKVPEYPEDIVLERGIDGLLHVSDKTNPEYVDGIEIYKSFDNFFSENLKLPIGKLNALLNVSVRLKIRMYSVWRQNAYNLLDYKRMDESDIVTPEDICMTFNPSTFSECANEIKTLAKLAIEERKQHTGSFYFPLYHIYHRVNRILSHSGKGISFYEFSAFIHSDSDIFYLSNDTLDKTTTVALQEDYEKESQVYYWLKTRLDKATPFPKYRAVNTEGLCEEQVKAVENMMLENGCVTILSGGPGTGKTTILKKIVLSFKEIYPDEKIAMLAPTGKAAKRIRETMGDTEVSVSTIHKFLGYTASKANYVLPKVIKKIRSTHCIIIDESSMLGSILFADLLSNLDIEHTKIILVGDINQLPSVDTGALLRDLIRMGIPVYELNENHRSADAQTIIKNSKAVNAGCEELIFNEQFSIRNNDIYECLDLILAEKNSIILSPYQTIRQKYSTQNINAYIHQNLPENGNTHFYPGEPVIITHTEYRMGTPVYIKGETGIIRNSVLNSDGTYSYSVQIAPENQILIPEHHLDYGYALTIHKSQGSEYDTVYVVLPDYNDFITKKMLYTAITRAKNRVVLFSTEKVLKKVIANNNDERRNTFLQDLSFTIINK